MKVSDIIEGQTLISARRDASLGEVADTMTAHRVTGVPIVDEWGVLCGLVTAATLAEIARGHSALPSEASWMPAAPHVEPSLPWRALAASAVMTSDLCTVMHDADITEAAKAMSNRGVHRAVVLGKDRNVMGVLSALDFVVLVAEGKLR
jgi:CBS domain-containing protein